MNLAKLAATSLAPRGRFPGSATFRRAAMRRAWNGIGFLGRALLRRGTIGSAFRPVGPGLAGIPASRGSFMPDRRNFGDGRKEPSRGMRRRGAEGWKAPEPR